MGDQPGSNAYFNVPDAYDSFMGRFSKHLSPQFVHSIPLTAGDRVLDLGCGPGALTASLVEMLGAEAVTVLDPSPPFLEACVRRYPGITGKVGAAEAIPFEDGSFDAVMSQLVIHFFVDMQRAGQEMVRVTRPGGWIAACTWLFDQMDMLHFFDVAARNVTGSAPPDPPGHGFRVEGAMSSYFTSLGLTDVSESALEVRAHYESFDELWSNYLGGIGPIAPWMAKQPDDVRSAIREELLLLTGHPSGAFELLAVARSARGRTPT